MYCILLAGGFATRLWPLTEARAKPLLHLKDKPLISHIVEGLPRALPVTVATNAVFEEEFKTWRHSFPDRNIRIFIEDSKEEMSKKGALGGLALALGELGIQDDLLVIAGDNYFGFKMEDFLAAFRGNPLVAVYDIGDRNQARRFGVVLARDRQIIGFQEKPQNPQSTLVSTGCFLFPQKNLKDIIDYSGQKKDDLGGIFEYLLGKKEKIDCFPFREKWFDVGSFEGYLKANQELLEGRIIEKAGVIKKGQNQLKGGVFLGNNTVIQDAILENTVILNDCEIINCVIRNSIIDEKCQLKNLDLTHKMIRRGSRIEK